jgi:hypothetical protein
MLLPPMPGAKGTGNDVPGEVCASLITLRMFGRDAATDVASDVGRLANDAKNVTSRAYGNCTVCN